MSREAYKYVFYRRAICSTIYLRLTTQSQAGLVSEALDKFLPFEPVLKFVLY